MIRKGFRSSEMLAGVLCLTPELSVPKSFLVHILAGFGI